MFSLLELLDPWAVAGCTSLRSGDLDFCHILSRFVFISMTDRALHTILAMLAQLPIDDNPRGYFLVAVHTCLSESRRDKNEEPQKNKNG
jgi:hypothetical protein